MTTLEQHISRVCEYIDQHLDDELSLERLSSVSGFSKFHFHRVFATCTGLNLNKFIQLARLKRASFRLVFQSQLKVLDVALEAGFDSGEAFARAFKREFGQTPTQFRQQPQWQAWHKKFTLARPTGERNMDVSIINFEKTKVALLEHRGAPERIYETSKQFIEWRKTSQLSPVKRSNTYGIVYVDPRSVAPEEFRFGLCGSVDKSIPENNFAVINSEIPAARCAVLRHHGSLNDIENTVCYLYNQWLPKQDEQLGDFPVFFHYLNFVHEVDEHELKTDVYLPLKTDDKK